MLKKIEAKTGEKKIKNLQGLKHKLNVVLTNLTLQEKNIKKINGKIYVYGGLRKVNYFHCKYDPKKRKLTLKTTKYKYVFDLNKNLFDEFWNIDYETVKMIYKVEQILKKI